MFFTRKPGAGELREVARRVQVMIEAGLCYDAVKLSHETLRPFKGSRSAPRELAEIMRLSGVAYLVMYQKQVHDADYDATDRVIRDSEEGKLALSNLRMVYEWEKGLGYKNTATVYYLAKVLILKSEYEEARDVVTGSDQLPGIETADYYVTMGRIAERWNETEKAFRFAKKAAELDPSHWWLGVYREKLTCGKLGEQG